MTDAVDLERLSAARAELDQLCRKVNLGVVAQLPTVDEEALPPAGTALWAGDYACVLLWPVPSTDESMLRSTAINAQGWFDSVLSRRESSKIGRIVDGYLVMALPAPPEGELKEEVRRLELSSQVCRKHLIWPAAMLEADPDSGNWLRIADVTVVGLPDAVTAASGDVYWPDLDQEASAVWSDINTLGPLPAAQQDGDGV